MAMIWITKIVHSSPGAGPLELRQDDPTWHPVINDHQYLQDELIVVQPGDTIEASYFLIPWAGYGRVNLSLGAGSIDHDVGQIHFGSQDHLRVRNAHDGVQVAAAEMGPQGIGTVCSIDVWLLIADGKPQFQFHQASGHGHVDVGRVVEQLVQVAAVVAAFF